MHNILQLANDQHLDEIYYWPSFIDAGNQFVFQPTQLKNDDRWLVEGYIDVVQ